MTALAKKPATKTAATTSESNKTSKVINLNSAALELDRTAATAAHVPAPVPAPAHAAGAPAANDASYWQQRFGASNSRYDASMKKISGARLGLWAWFGNVAGDRAAYAQATLQEKLHIHTAVEARLSAIGETLPKKPNYANLIVKVQMFGDHDLSNDDARRRRLQKQLSAYLNVFRAAENSNIAPTEVPKWIEERNGIERIRLKDKKSGSGNSTDSLFQTLAAGVRAATKFSFTVNDTDIAWDGDKDHPEMVLLASYYPSTKTITVNAVVKNNKDAYDAVIRIQNKTPKASTAAPAPAPAPAPTVPAPAAPQREEKIDEVGF